MGKIMNLRNNIFFITIFLSFLFFLVIIIDINPYIRNFNDPNLSYRWTYYYVNTWSRLWAPLCIVILYAALFYFIDSRKFLKSKLREILFLSLTVFIVFFFQLSLVYFSRFGLTVLFRRMADSGINGYFTAALSVTNPGKFMKDFPKINKNLFQHVPTHPPGTILLLKGVIVFFESNQGISKIIYSYVREPQTDSKPLWNGLSQSERIATIFSAFFAHFLAALSVIPLYFLVKRLSSIEVAQRSVFFYSFIPAVCFFAPFFDPFYAVFSLFSAYLVTFGIYRNRVLYAFLGGMIFGLGLFFSLSILPLLFFLLFFSVIFFIKRKRLLGLSYGVNFVLGLFLSFFIFYIIGFNFYLAFPSILSAASHNVRLYLPTIIFNPYDFLLFLSFPLSTLFILSSIIIFKKRTFRNSILYYVLLSFLCTSILLILSGSTRGEVGRIWLPIMAIPVYVVSSNLTSLKFDTKKIIIFVLLVAFQTIILEEFWVPVW